MRMGMFGAGLSFTFHENPPDYPAGKVERGEHTTSTFRKALAGFDLYFHKPVVGNLVVFGDIGGYLNSNIETQYSLVSGISYQSGGSLSCCSVGVGVGMEYVIKIPALYGNGVYTLAPGFEIHSVRGLVLRLGTGNFLFY